MHGSDMMTSDIDIVIPKEMAECRKLVVFARKKKYSFRIGGSNFRIKEAIDLFPLRYLELVCVRKRKPLPNIDIFLGRSYDDVDFNDIECEIVKIGNLAVRVATAEWLIDHKGNREKDDLGIANMKMNIDYS